MEKKKAATRFYMRKIDNLLNVQKIVTIHYQELEKNYAAKEEKHDFWEMIYADKGNTYVVTDGVFHLLKQGETYFIPPNLPHYVACLENEPNIFIISFSCRSESIRFFADRTVAVPANLSYLLENVLAEARETFVLPDFDPALKKLELREKPNIGGEQVIKNSLELLMISFCGTEKIKPRRRNFSYRKSPLPPPCRMKSCAIFRRICTARFPSTNYATKFITAKRIFARFLKNRREKPSIRPI